ncbi:WD repeat-containing protein 61 [Phellopilus nigrolimitatus]|nr:WD repeat-containing protein 61 [Phellopilus nigrolimitatus]
MSLQYLHAHDSTEKHADAVWAVHWTAADRVVSASADGSVKQWDAASGQSVSARPAHPLGVVSLSVADAPAGGGGARALYNTLEGHTALWDLDADALVGAHDSFVREKDPGEPAWGVSLHPTGETYAATGAAGGVSVHSAAPDTFGARLASMDSGRKKFGMAIAHSPDGARVALALETGQLFLFDLAAHALAATYTAHAAPVRALAWSADGALLLSASDDRRLTLFDVRAGSAGSARGGGGAVAALVGHASWVLSAALSPDGRLALSGSADKTIKVWDVAARAAVSTVKDTGEVWSVAWRPNVTPGSAGAFVSAGEDGLVKWWRGAGAA